MDKELQNSQANLTDQMAQNKQQKFQIERLQKKIDGFSNNQSEVSIKFSNFILNYSSLKKEDSKPVAI